MKAENEIHKIIDSTFYETQKIISYEISYRKEKLKESVDCYDYGSIYYHMREIEKNKDFRLNLKLVYDTLKNRIN